ncbi:MAG: TPM domain-containing protein [Sphingomonadales bacterium]|nr:TPM domain-containing protein [Sphingomonadales bacterium]MDE2568374.1 TPM domain-containing protein [Sphingomonadales bacterium]
MKKLVLAVLIGVAIVGGGAAAWVADKPVAAARVVAPLELTGRVVDDAHLLSAVEAQALDAKLAAIEKTAGPQFVVVTTPSLEGRDIADYSLALGNGWGVGDRTRNDGVLLVVAPNEQRVRIEVGKGLEKTLPDELCAQFIREIIVPHFKRGDFAGGITAGVDRIDAVLLAQPTLAGAKT